MFVLVIHSEYLIDFLNSSVRTVSIYMYCILNVCKTRTSEKHARFSLIPLCVMLFGSFVNKMSGVIGYCWPISSSRQCSTALKSRCYLTTFVDTPRTRTNSRYSKSRSRNLKSPSVSSSYLRTPVTAVWWCLPYVSQAVGMKYVQRCRCIAMYSTRPRS